jgi:hypothetical protein
MHEQAKRHPARRPLTGIAIGALLAAAALHACVEPPPKIASIPKAGLALRVHVFGAQASEARRSIESVKENNKNFSVVKEGGDGEVVLGLENDSPKCVAPTALCSYKIAVRVKDKDNKVVHVSTTTVAASSDRCSDLCAKALVDVAVKVVEIASASLKGEAVPEASTPTTTAAVEDAEVPVEDAGAPDTGPPPKTKPHGKKGKTEPPKPAEPAKPEPIMCAVGHGARLPTEDAEKRAAQVEALKRLSVLEQDEYDCLRKAYLDRL